MTDTKASPQMMDYFERFRKHCYEAFDIANIARAKGYDPEKEVSVTLAETLAERVIGLISVIAPQIKNAGVEQRIEELEAKYGSQDWRVAFIIAHEIAQQKYCKFDDELAAIICGVRVGFAYVTLGVVSAPLEGITEIELKNRNDGQGKYFSLRFAGPIRNAGGTAAATCVLIADYVRVKMGYPAYDPTEKEIKRCPAELEDYHEWITNLQYFPSKEESIFLMERIPVEISGDESEKYEVSNINLKDLPRIPENKLRSGYCLIHSSCIPLKAAKLWKNLGKWGKEMDMGHWDFLEEFLALQKKMKAAGKKATTTAKITPDYTYIKDLVAGRPVLGYPLRPGGFRLRYGRSRASGYSGQALHPATMLVLNNYVASATQLKVERPGKAASYMPCDTIEGPIVRLKSGQVLQLSNDEDAMAAAPQIESILYLGDVLINYGDFYNRNHSLVPVGYCPEWWIQEVERTVKEHDGEFNAQKLSAITGVAPERCQEFISDPLHAIPTVQEALTIAHSTNTPLHSSWTYFWSLITLEQLKALLAAINMHGTTCTLLKTPENKDILEVLGIPHHVGDGILILEEEHALAMLATLGVDRIPATDILTIVERMPAGESILTIIESIGGATIRDKAGTFIGARMGRPEKAKMRKLTGSPHTLFPIGDEGGRLRSVQETLIRGKINADYPLRFCTVCKINTIFGRCEMCDNETEQRTMQKVKWGTKDEMETVTHTKQEIEIRRIFDACLKKIGYKIYPDLIKGVRGTSNKSHIPEHLVKGIVRAKHRIHVNKDGTVRYDCSEVTLTHFRPREVGTSVAKLLELGYLTDCYGKPLENEDQVLELRPQDIVLPCCPDSPDEPADEIMYRTGLFVDEILVKLYGMKPFYNFKSKEDVTGHYVVGLAPHTSAGIVGRIVGCSKTQGFLAHPLYHAAMRRDCFAYDTYLPIKTPQGWCIERLGDLVERINPQKKVDAHGTLEAKPKGYSTVGIQNGNTMEVPVHAFTKHTPMPMLEIASSLGKKVKTTANHKHIIVREGKEIQMRAGDLQVGDVLKLPYRISVPSEDVKRINLLEELTGKEWLMVKGLGKLVPDLRSRLVALGVERQDASNFSSRDSVPADIAKKIIGSCRIDQKKLHLSAKRDSVEVPAIIDLTDDMLTCIGLYVAEGYARNQKGEKGSYQVYIAAQRHEIRAFVKKTFASIGLKPSERKNDRVTYSSRIIYELFTNVLGAGSSAYEKRIPARLLCLPPVRLGKLLDGYLEGDGSVSKTDLRIVFDTVSEGLVHDLEFILGRIGIFLKIRRSTRLPGKPLQEFYKKKGREVPYFTCTRGIIQSRFVAELGKIVSFISREKKEKLAYILARKKFRNLFCEYDNEYFYDEIVAIDEKPAETSYCLNVENHTVVANGILTRQCDGDESCFSLLMDVFLNFSAKFLPETRGSTMDAPLVLTYFLNPAEVDDMAFHVDTAWVYPLEMYEAALEYKKPFDVKVPLLGDFLFTPKQFEGMGFTHDTHNLNAGVLCSAYKTLPSMAEKLFGQMDLAVKIKACDAQDVARLVIEKHFLRDTKGNLRKFTQQEYRCVACNEKFRRPPLVGHCTACKGKIVFTISEGSVIKYLEPSLSLARKYGITGYLMQDLELLERKVVDLFGKDAERQEGLGKWFG